MRPPRGTPAEWGGGRREDLGDRDGLADREGHRALREHAIKCLFEAGRGAALFMDDGSHPSAGGDAVTARTFVETFFGK